LTDVWVVEENKRLEYTRLTERREMVTKTNRLTEDGGSRAGGKKRTGHTPGEIEMVKNR